MARDVFISYRQEDQAVADRVCDALERRHVDCWMAPRDRPPGEERPEAIMGGIEQCHTFVLLLSENCQRSRQIARELELADSHALRIIALRIHDVQPPPQLLFFLGNVQWLDAFGDHFDASIARLADAMRRSDTHPDPHRPTGSRADLFRSREKAQTHAGQNRRRYSVYRRCTAAKRTFALV
jgi:hypothetical protein